MCEYCEPNEHGICMPMAKRGIGINTPLVDIQRNENTNKLEMLVHYDSEESLRLAINKCPMCGRKLTEAGIKKEEYREIKPFWEKRLLDYKAIKADVQALAFKRYVLRIPYDVCKDYPRGYDTLVFTLGYPKAGDTERRLTFKNPKIRIDEGKPEWGAEPNKLYFVITWEA